MTVAWMLYVILVGTLLACAAVAGEVALRRTALPARTVWIAALAGTVVLAVLAPREQQVTAVALPAATVHMTAPRITAAKFSLRTAITNAAVQAERTVTRAIVEVERRAPAPLRASLVIAWIAATLAILALLVEVNRRLNRERRAWPVAHIDGAPVRVAPLVGPAVVGLSHPEIVVPRWLLQRNTEEQRLVVLHELEHLAARDQLLLTGAWCAAALLPWHPAMWWMLSRLRLAIELDCDARVLHRGVQARPYGTLLIDIASQCAGFRLGALALADKTTHLERRLLAMKPTRSRFAIARAATLGCVAAVSILAACEARMPTSSEIGAMDATTAVKTAQEFKIVRDSAALLYIVDGKIVPTTTATAIPASQIASVDIWKSTKPSAPSQINIVTIAGAAKSSKISASPGTIPLIAKVDKVVMADSGLKGVKVALAKMHAGSVDEFRIASDSFIWAPRTASGGTPLVYIDGVKASMADMKRINPADIASVDIIKGPAAIQEVNDPDAVYGVIKIVTKKASAP